MIVSEDSAISSSKEAYVEMLKPYAQKGRVDNDPALKERVYRITGRLIAQAIKMRPETENWEWSIKIIDDPETVNAWAMAGGQAKIFFRPVFSLHNRIHRKMLGRSRCAGINPLSFQRFQ